MGKMLGELLYEQKPGVFMHWCPGCKMPHPIHVGDRNHLGASWGWNSSITKPTFVPSVNVANGRCHYFITDGQIRYLTDSQHALAGTTVELPVFPEDERDW